MIPKIIHYCWFGEKELPKKAKHCIASWKKYCPDYEIIEWNERNFDIHMNGYTEMCHNEKRFAFLSDYARLYIVEKQGGIYLDTDVELVKSIDDLLGTEAYFGFETNDFINTGLGFGSIAHGQILKRMIAEYDPLLDGKHGVVGCPRLNTKALEKIGLKKNGSAQNLPGAIVYPKDYFNPFDDSTGILHATENTYSIHWYSKSWMKKSSVIRSKLTRPLHIVQKVLKKEN